MNELHSFRERDTTVTCNVTEKYGVLMIRGTIPDLSPEDEEFFREKEDEDI